MPSKLVRTRLMVLELKRGGSWHAGVWMGSIDLRGRVWIEMGKRTRKRQSLISALPDWETTCDAYVVVELLSDQRL